MKRTEKEMERRTKIATVQIRTAKTKNEIPRTRGKEAGQKAKVETRIATTRRRRRTKIEREVPAKSPKILIEVALTYFQKLQL